MSHLDPVRPSAQWPNELVTGAADWRKFDENQKKALSQNGGSWNPTSPITIGGAGLKLATSGSQLTGGLLTRAGGSIQLAASEFPSLNARTRTILVDLLDAPPASLGAAGDAAIYASLPTLPTPGAPPQVFLSGVVPHAAQTSLFGTIPSRYLHHGAGSYLSSVTLTFSVLIAGSAPSIVTSPGLPGANTSCTLTVLPLDNTTSIPANIPSQPAQKSASPFTPSNLAAAGNLTVWAPGLNVSPSGISGPEYGATYVVPSSAKRNQPYSYFSANIGVGGVTANPEPTWNTTPGSITVGSDGVQWTCVGPVGVLYAPNLTALLNGGLSQSLTMALDTSLVSFPQTIDNTQYGYAYQLSNLPPGVTVIYSSIAFTFTHITSLAFE